MAWAAVLLCVGWFAVACFVVWRAVVVSHGYEAGPFDGHEEGRNE